MNLIKKSFLLVCIILLFISITSAADVNDSAYVEDVSLDADNYNFQEDNSAVEIDDSYKLNNNYKNNYKNIQKDNENIVDEKIEYVNVTSDNFKQYFNVIAGEMFMGKRIEGTNNSLVLNLQYVPNTVKALSLDSKSNNYLNKTLTITSKEGIQFNNTELYVDTNFKTFTLENLNFKYENGYSNTGYVMIEHNVQKCILRNITVDMNVDGVSGGYLVELNGLTIIENSNIKGKFIETEIDWLEGPKTPKAYGIRIYSRDCVLRNNTIDIRSSGHLENSSYYSLYGIYVMNYNTTLEDNTIFLNNCTGYAYAVVVRSSNNTISRNKISVSSITYSNAVMLEMVMFQNNTINNNFVNVTASYGNAPWRNAAVAYGLIMLDFNYHGGSYSGNGRHPTNNSFVNNTIVGSAGQIYGIEIYGTGNTNLSGNIINITGRTPMGIGAIGSNITIANNIIINNGTHNKSEGTADYLEAVNTGLFTFYSSSDMVMINNTITSINGRGIFIKNSANVIIKENNVSVTDHDYAVEMINGKNNTVENNTLITTKHTGNKAVNGTINNTVQNNIPEEPIIISLKINTTEFTNSTNNTLKANIYYDDEIATNISKGKVSFKVNGKTLKDSNGKILYAKIINGTATIENYEIPSNWKENSTIQAIYSGSDECTKLTSQIQQLTITQQTPTLTTEDITTTRESTITLKATINTNVVMKTGKILFKINNKTVKDSNGKVIYAKLINNTVCVEYTLLKSYKVGEYNITAVFISSDYPKLEDVKTLVVNA